MAVVRIAQRFGGHSLFVLSVLYFVWVAGPHMNHSSGDAEQFYTAGRCWLAGDTSYNSTTWAQVWPEVNSVDTDVDGRRSKTGLVYPPTLAIVASPLSIFSIESFRWLFFILNIAGWLAICAFVFWIATDIFGFSRSDPLVWSCLGLAGLSSQALSFSLKLGQMGLISLSIALCVVWAWKSGRPWIAALLIPVATIKPQVSLLLLVYLLVGGGVRVALLGGSITLAFVAALLVRSPGGIFTAFESVLFEYDKFRHAPIEFDQLWNYWSIAGLWGNTSYGNSAMLLGVAIAVSGVVYIGMRRSSVNASMGVVGQNEALMDQGTWRSAWVWDLMLVLALGIGFLPFHPYDFVPSAVLLALSPVIPRRRLKLAFILMCFLAGHGAHFIQIGTKVWGEAATIQFRYVPHVLNGGVFVFTTWLWKKYAYASLGEARAGITIADN